MKTNFLRILALIHLAAAFLLALSAGAGAEGLEQAGTEAVKAGERLPVGAVALDAGALAEVDLSVGGTFVFTAPTGSVYEVWLFPAGDEAVQAHAELWQNGLPMARGDGAMPALSLRLTAGAESELRLTGTGNARLEIARSALSRCFARPMALEAGGDAYAKAFARSGDAHWYAMDADSARPVSVMGVPSDAGLSLRLQLFDDAGHLLMEGRRTEGGACLMDFTPEAGRRYLFRLTDAISAMGLYELRLARFDAAAQSLALEPEAAALSGRSGIQLSAKCVPADANGPVYWESSDPGIARVDGNGFVIGRGGGEAVITAHAPSGATARCRVSVEYVPVASVSLLSHRMALRVGDDAAIECDVLPANASDPRLSYAVEPEGIVQIDPRGVLQAVGEGVATVTVRAMDGGLEDVLTVQVNPAPRRWRALLVGEQNYAATVAAVRTGSVNSVNGLRSMLEGLSFSGSRVRVSTLLDASRDGVLAAIPAAFSEAGDGDASLFYITCHGSYSGGMTYFTLYDGSVLSAAELAQALDEVKGDVLVVIDCCGSGGVIGEASGTQDILKGIDAVFGGTLGPGPLALSRFKVLASATLEQDSYRISFSDAAAESGMATVFARALCEAGGWSLERSARAPMRADVDVDGRVTLTELYNYTARRVMWYLNLTAQGRYAQTVQVWPQGDGTVVFERQNTP